MIARYQHIVDDDVINAESEKKNGKDAINRPISNIKQAESLKIADASMQLSKISEENIELKKQMDSMTTMFNKDVIEAMINARVKEMLKKTEINI